MMNVIIEHPRRGTFNNVDEWGKPHFSLTGARNDPDKTRIFSSIGEAWDARCEIPSPERFECYILVYVPNDQSYYKLVKV